MESSQQPPAASSHEAGRREEDRGYSSEIGSAHRSWSCIKNISIDVLLVLGETDLSQASTNSR